MRYSRIQSAVTGGAPYVPPVARSSVHMLFIGESNSGGYANNIDATELELSETSVVKILDNTNLDAMLNLKISDPNSNNMIGHAGFEGFGGIIHGWELELANKGRADFFGKDIYLTKCGQGGSIVANWVGGPSAYLDAFYDRYNATISLIPAGATSHVWMSFGINDAIAVTDPSVWYTKMITFIDLIRAKMGDVMIYATTIPLVNQSYIDINDKILLLEQNLAYFKTVDTSSAAMKDTNHWDYAGMKYISNLLCVETLNELS